MRTLSVVPLLLLPTSSLLAISCSPVRPRIPHVPEAQAPRSAPADGAGESPADTAAPPRTRVSVPRGEWHINGKITYPGSRAEGLLLNVRMVNCTFEDRNPKTSRKEFDPEKNTDAFLAKIPDYTGSGIRAFTLCFQGGDPGYKGALNSAYNPDGSLRPQYVRRVARVIEACDHAGAAVILGCFHPMQDQVLEDEEAVKRAVMNTAAWIRERGYGNVCLEIANEHADPGYDHAIIKDPTGIRRLIDLARKAAPDLLISASGMGGGRLAHAIAVEADFILLHFNNVPLDKILERVASADKVSKAIVCNEDPREGADRVRALDTAVNAYCSWGLANLAKNQYYPFTFEGAADDPVVYARFKELTQPAK